MTTSRRNAVIGLGASAAALLIPTGIARAAVSEPYANLMRKVMGLHWRGKARIETELIEGGRLLSNLEMDFTLDSGWEFTGRMVEKVNFDGTIYTGTSTIWGNCWAGGDNAGLSITRMRNDSGDRLPGDLVWGTSHGELAFGNDTTRPGHFQMEGVLRDDDDGTAIQVLMIDMA